MLSERIHYERLDVMQGCLVSALLALRTGLEDHAAGDAELALRRYRAAESCLTFAETLAVYLRSRRCRYVIELPDT